VRQIVDANGNVTLAESYEPYGSVLSSNGDASSIFAYAGEQIDTTGLVYLRARYMNPTLGIFFARDPWNGNALRPGSMNRFGYVEGNPIKLTDHSGLVPEFWKIGKDDGFQYSCNCGWIDWSHVAFGTAKGVIENFATGVGQYPISLADHAPVPQLLSGTVTSIYSVDYNLGQNSYQALAAALGVFEEFETRFERYQGGENLIPRGAGDRVSHSSFSEEDLTSDLLGFYGAVWETRGFHGTKFSGDDHSDSKKQIRELCKVVGLNDDPATYYRKQFDIYLRYVVGRPIYGLPKMYSIPPIGFQDVFEWGRPRLADIDSGWCPGYCSEPDRGFPQDFQEFIPNHGGFWRWISGNVKLHSLLGFDQYYEYTMDELNNRDPHSN